MGSAISILAAFGAGAWFALFYLASRTDDHERRLRNLETPNDHP